MQTPETSARARAYAESLPTARAPRLIGWSTLLNGYSYPDRRAATAHGHAVLYRQQDGNEPAIALWRTDLGDPGSRACLTAHNAVFIIDDKRTATPYYVAGYSAFPRAGTDPIRADMPDAGLLFLHPYEVNAGALAPWRLAPTRAYHVTLDHVSAFDDWHTERYGQAHPLRIGVPA